jgi:hypothetical protein
LPALLLLLLLLTTISDYSIIRMVGINMNPVQHEDASSLLASDEALFCG